MGIFYIIILATGVGFVYESNRPTEYDLIMNDGSSREIIIDKTYSCPLHCKVDHIHHAKKCKSSCTKDHNNFHIHSYKEMNKATTLSLNYKKNNILSMSKVSLHKKNKNTNQKK
ncbi:MAG: hypothetical protein CBD58_00500 [bacterium TMED198]|nr:MAG: hypothetical protein CBD58_00500 [bacterium TMED198]